MSNYNSDRAFLVDELTQKVTSVTTSATELFTGGSRNARRQVMRIYNDSTVTVFVGPSGVTATGSTRGEPILKKESLEITIGDVAIFGIVASGTADVIITELA
jgi:hypothetical protein